MFKYSFFFVQVTEEGLSFSTKKINNGDKVIDADLKIYSNEVLYNPEGEGQGKGEHCSPVLRNVEISVEREEKER